MIWRLALRPTNAPGDRVRARRPTTKSFQPRFDSARGGGSRRQTLRFAKAPDVLELTTRKAASHWYPPGAAQFLARGLASAPAGWGRHPCLPVGGASLPRVSGSAGLLGHGNGRQGCRPNWQARMPAPPRPRACRRRLPRARHPGLPTVAGNCDAPGTPAVPNGPLTPLRTTLLCRARRGRLTPSSGSPAEWLPRSSRWWPAGRRRRQIFSHAYNSRVEDDPGRSRAV